MPQTCASLPLSPGEFFAGGFCWPKLAGTAPSVTHVTYFYFAWLLLLCLSDFCQQPPFPVLHLQSCIWNHVCFFPPSFKKYFFLHPLVFLNKPLPTDYLPGLSLLREKCVVIIPIPCQSHLCLVLSVLEFLFQGRLSPTVVFLRFGLTQFWIVVVRVIVSLHHQCDQ